MNMLSERFVTIEQKLHGVLVRHAISALRITVGLIFLGFGVLKFFPGVSPAQNLSIKTIDLLTFGLIPWEVAIVAIAALECFIGICLLANRWMRLAVWLLAIEFVGILAPLVLLTGRLFSGPHHAPTLEGQYVLKDIILVAAGMTIAAGTFRGGRLIRDEPATPDAPPASPIKDRTTDRVTATATQDPSSWIGSTLIDASGAKLGTIQEIYFDEKTNQPATMAINAGGLLDNKHRVVPLELASPSADGIQVPYDKATVKDAPNLDLDDDLPADQVTALYRHYSLNADNAPNGDAEHTVGR